MKLYSKLLLCMVPATVLSAESIIVYSRKAVHEIMISQIEKHVMSETDESAALLASNLVRHNENALLTILQSLARNTESASVYMSDMHGVVVADMDVGGTGRVVKDPNIASALKTDKPHIYEIPFKGRRTLYVITPIHEGTLDRNEENFILTGVTAPAHKSLVGAVSYEIPLEATLVLEQRIARELLWIVCLCIGAMTTALLLLMRQILAPVHLLLSGTNKIRRGEYGALIPVRTNDEIGQLTSSFNAMSGDLATTTVSKKFINNILETMQDPLIVTDNEGRITMLNPAVPALLGRSAQSLMGHPAATFIENGEALLRAPKIGIHATCFLAKDGKKMPVLISLAPLRGAEGEALGVVLVAKDVSEIKKLESRMQQSEKLSAVGQLAAGVAHEINNPLGVILGFAQGMARQTKVGDPLELPIKSIEREALRCKNLVQDLLTFARTSHSDREGMDLNATIEQAMSLVRTQIKMGRVILKVDLGAGLPMILGNKNQIQQVVMNLAKNAIDAMPNGGALTIKTELIESAPQSWVCLEVSDTGTGIPAPLQARIFEPFFTTKSVGQGTGLGLSLVAEIVKKHSGEIDVASGPGRTVFRAMFPARTGREIEQQMSELQRVKVASAPVYNSERV